MCENNAFLYFAYGSNLLAKRIHIQNPSAEFVSIAKLDNHQLSFIKESENWGGASGTLVPQENDYVWGAVWKLKCEDLSHLDMQEGVSDNWYFPKQVTVTTPENKALICRTYQQTVNPEPLQDIRDLPEESKPSETYLSVILKGAIECNLPSDYIDKLRTIPHNGKKACQRMLECLELL